MDKSEMNASSKSIMISTKSSKYNNQLIAKAEREIKERRSEMATGPKSYKDLMNAYNDDFNQSLPDFKAAPFTSKALNENTFLPA